MMSTVETNEVIRLRRRDLGLSQADVAALAGVDRRQIRRYESGDTQPTLPVARALARALRITVDELAGEDTRRIDLSGAWWACWQTWKDGSEVINPHQIRMRQQGDAIEVIAVTRGTPLDEGGYLWRGELRLWDNEALTGWYIADEGAVRSKGAMYFTVHQHGGHMTGRWVGLSYDGPLITGWGTMARDEHQATELMQHLREKGTAGDDH
jgi:transcriptional regulator with XRE-family HTH domain